MNNSDGDLKGRIYDVPPSLERDIYDELNHGVRCSLLDELLVDDVKCKCKCDQYQLELDLGRMVEGRSS